MVIRGRRVNPPVTTATRSDVIHRLVSALGELLEVDGTEVLLGSLRDVLPNHAHDGATFSL